MSEVQNQDLNAWGAPRQQTVFRQLMRAFSFPGRIQTLTEGEALTQTLATLVDREATLADPQDLLKFLIEQAGKLFIDLKDSLQGPSHCRCNFAAQERSFST